MTDKMLDSQQQQFLLQLARDAIKCYLQTGKHLEIQCDKGPLKEKLGAFVTLKLKNSLKGCVGYPLPYKSLFETIIEAAVMAAFFDNRFTPVQEEDLPDIRIEISVLSLPEPVDNIQDIEIGTHGIIVSLGLNRGLLLPQVPVEWDWDRETFLRHGCIKAGLAENAWRTGAQLESFTAQVFSEAQANDENQKK